MSISMIQNTQATQTIQPQSAPAKAPQPQSPEKTLNLSTDTLNAKEIKKGIVPSLLGGGAGALIGAGGGYAAAIGIANATNMGSGALALLGIPMVAAPAGAIAGGVVANMTDSAGKGTLLGAGVGAVAGAATGAAFTGGNIQLTLISAGIGAVSGALSGVTSSFIAQEK